MPRGDSSSGGRGKVLMIKVVIFLQMTVLFVAVMALTPACAFTVKDAGRE